MGLSSAQAELLATERWGWLGAFLQTWYADPLDASDGASEQEIAQAEQRMGRRLPAELSEWFTLVGHRLHAVQDTPATLSDASADDDGIEIWSENQNVWSIQATDDGRTVCDPDDFGWPDLPIAQALHSLTISDTLVAVWAAGDVGALGRLSDTAVGGVIADVSPDELAVAEQQWPEIVPYFGTVFHGDDATVVRGDEFSGMGLEWMAATTAATDSFASVIPLDPPGGMWEVVASFDGLSPQLRELLTDAGRPSLERWAPTIRQVAQPVMAALGDVDATFQLDSTDPQATAAALAASAPDAVRANLVIRYRPGRGGRYTIAYPPSG